MRRVFRQIPPTTSGELKFGEYESDAVAVAGQLQLRTFDALDPQAITGDQTRRWVSRRGSERRAAAYVLVIRSPAHKHPWQTIR